MLLNTQFDRPATVLLSAMWTLAAVLTLLAFAVSFDARAKAPPVAPTMHTPQFAHAKTVESVTSSSMLRQPGFAISKDKLD